MYFYSLTIAVDNFKIVYGYCIKENNKIIENNKFFLKTSPFTNSASYIKQRLKRSDNEYVQDTCGGVYNLKFGSSLIIQNPGYPFSYEFNKKCVYLIKVISKNISKIILKICYFLFSIKKRHQLI